VDLTTITFARMAPFVDRRTLVSRSATGRASERQRTDAGANLGHTRLDVWIGRPGRQRMGVRQAGWPLGGRAMIVLGVILLIVGFVLAIPILWTIGVILAVIGLALWVLGSIGHQVGSRAHYY